MRIKIKIKSKCKDKKEFLPKNVSYLFMIVAVGLSFLCEIWNVQTVVERWLSYLDARCGTEELVKKTLSFRRIYVGIAFILLSIIRFWCHFYGIYSLHRTTTRYDAPSTHRYMDMSCPLVLVNLWLGPNKYYFFFFKLLINITNFYPRLIVNKPNM